MTTMTTTKRAGSRYTIQGIDVSHWQDEIDHSAVWRDGVQFAYVKFTEGATYQDPMRFRNLGFADYMPVGAYHLFRETSKGVEQYENFMSEVGQCEKGALTLPYAIDLEHSVIDETPDAVSFYKDLLEFLSRFQALVVIYTSYRAIRTFSERLGWDKQSMVSAIEQDVDLCWWWCDYKTSSWDNGLPRKLVTKRPWVFWQVTSSARVDGIDGNVDLNYLNTVDWELEDIVQVAKKYSCKSCKRKLEPTTKHLHLYCPGCHLMYHYPQQEEE